MFASLVMASALAAQGAPAQAQDVVVTAAETDPATLINRAAELVRAGEVEEARALYEKVKRTRVAYTLETVDGRWVYPPDLAREALRGIEQVDRRRATFAARD